MTQISAFRVRTVACTVGLLLAVSACGSSSTTSDSTVAGDGDPIEDTSPDATDASEVTGTTDAVEETPTSAAQTPAEGGGGSGDMQIELSDGRTWSLTTSMCTFDPAASGPAAAVFNLGGYNDDGVELNALEAWPLDGSTDNGTSFIGNFVDENDDLYIFVAATAAMDGDTFELVTDYQTDVFYEADAEPIGTVTVRCQP